LPLGETLRISETAGILQCKLKVIEGTWANTQQQPRMSMLAFGRELRYAGPLGEGNDMSRLRKTFLTCPVILCL
jgi:hypothetical protein